MYKLQVEQLENPYKLLHRTIMVDRCKELLECIVTIKPKRIVKLTIKELIKYYIGLRIL